MPDPEARERAVYDHTDDESRPAGRRRRQVADWGVGEELFDGMPGRRFERRGDDHTIPRGGADDGRRTIVITDGEPRFEDEAADEEFTSREDALEARRRHEEVWAGDEPFADEGAREATSARADDSPGVADAPLGDEAVAPSGRFAQAGFDERFTPHDEDTPDGIVRGGVQGRRTVKIGGRPAEFHSASGRRRPSRTVHERVGPRPDRIAAWACALGLLLILIAIATASI
jgi:hypothetical protein